MAIVDVRAVTVHELLESGQWDIRVPSYQRPYSWKPSTAGRLFEDISLALRSPVNPLPSYVLGSVILHHAHADGHHEVVDGQQRLITLLTLVSLLDGREVPVPAAGQPATPLGAVRTELRRSVGHLSLEERIRFLEFVRGKCELVLVVTNSQDEAFRVFDSQNYRGKSLKPHDLLKAHHLREMRDESASAQAAVVERWESATEDELDRLFSVYLYRIQRWSRGESAPGFTSNDIELFKGISARDNLLPSELYHAAAQAALPMLSLVGAGRAPDAQALQRARFQMTVPVLAGRTFFEMVDFMQQELLKVLHGAFTDATREFSYYSYDSVGKCIVERKGNMRYRYVTELYLAASLLCPNRFGPEGLEQSRDVLFQWAYSLRTQLQRVQYRSIDNLGYGKGDPGASPFVLLRTGTSAGGLFQIEREITRPRDGHEGSLFALLTGDSSNDN